EHLAGRAQPIAVEPRGVGDPEGRLGCRVVPTVRDPYHLYSIIVRHNVRLAVAEPGGVRTRVGGVSFLRKAYLEPRADVAVLQGTDGLPCRPGCGARDERRGRAGPEGPSGARESGRRAGARRPWRAAFPRGEAPRRRRPGSAAPRPRSRRAAASGHAHDPRGPLVEPVVARGPAEGSAGLGRPPAPSLRRPCRPRRGEPGVAAPRPRLHRPGRARPQHPRRRPREGAPRAGRRPALGGAVLRRARARVRARAPPPREPEAVEHPDRRGRGGPAHRPRDGGGDGHADAHGARGLRRPAWTRASAATSGARCTRWASCSPRWPRAGRCPSRLRPGPTTRTTSGSRCASAITSRATPGSIRCSPPPSTGASTRTAIAAIRRS